MRGIGREIGEAQRAYGASLRRNYGRIMTRKHLARRGMALAAGILITGCAHEGNTWLRGQETSATDNQMMLIRREPPSTGWVRLEQQAVRHPDVGAFLQMKGAPDFLAESNTGERRYMIFYYLKNRQAFACRMRNGRGGNVEFAGPYPITDREFQLLDGFRKGTLRPTQDL